jgi:hypothetical protein
MSWQTSGAHKRLMEGRTDTQPTKSTRASPQDVTDRSPDAQKPTGGWWEAVKQSIKSFGSNSTSHGATTPAPSPTVALPDPPTPRETLLTLQDTPPTHPAHARKTDSKAVEDERRRYSTARPRISRPLKKYIHKYDPYSESQEQPSKVAGAHKSDVDRARLEKGGQRASLHGQSSPAWRAEEKPVIQQQLKQLVGQVRALQAMLEKKTEKQTSALQPGSHIAASQSMAVASLNRSKHDTSSQEPKSLLGRSQSGLPPTRHIVRDATEGHLALMVAKVGYRESTTALMRIAAELEVNLPRLAAPIVARIQARLVVDVQAHLEENDFFLKRHVAAFPWPNAHFKRQIALLSPATERSKRLEHFQQEYRDSVRVLVGIANDIDDMGSPSLATIKSMNLRRLEIITKVAKVDNDTRMHSFLGEYKHYRSRIAIDRTLKHANRRLETLTTSRIPRVLEERDGPEELSVTSGKPRMPNVPEQIEGSEEPPVISGTRLTRTKSSPSIIHLKSSVDSTQREQSLQEPAITLGMDLVHIDSSPSLKHMKSSFLRASRERRGTRDKVNLVEVPGRGTVKAKDSAHPQDRVMEKKNDGQRLTRQIHTHSRMMKSSDYLHADTHEEAVKKPNTQQPTKSSDVKAVSDTTVVPQSANTLSPEPAHLSSKEVSDQSLLEELFPEISAVEPSQYVDKRDKYPKLDLPESSQLIRKDYINRPKTLKERVVESFQKSGEKITVLQLQHCSTELTDMDFRRLIPKGEHIESWNREGEYYKIIPGRDPLSLERLPFYYLLFNSPRSAYAYQTNATRLHKLAALHQTTNIFSAIPPPKGFLEDGEDIHKATSSYVLKAPEHSLSLRTLMQPYHPALRALIEQGGYKPIVPDVDDKGNHIYKVLMHIEGYEPSPSDLFKIFGRDAYKHGMSLSLRNESSSSVHRLRDIINLKTRMQPLSTPRAFYESDTPRPTAVQFDDPMINFLMQGDLAGGEGENAKVLNQIVMNRVYNRWLVEFDNEDEARRFALRWHRKRLPTLGRAERTWKDWEEAKRCNCEFLW